MHWRLSRVRCDGWRADPLSRPHICGQNAEKTSSDEQKVLSPTNLYVHPPFLALISRFPPRRNSAPIKSMHRTLRVEALSAKRIRYSYSTRQHQQISLQTHRQTRFTPPQSLVPPLLRPTRIANYHGKKVVGGLSACCITWLTYDLYDMCSCVHSGGGLSSVHCSVMGHMGAVVRCLPWPTRSARLSAWRIGYRSRRSGRRSQRREACAKGRPA